MYSLPHSKDIETIQAHIRSWKNTSPEKLRFEPLAGLTNQIWKVTNLTKSITPKSIVFRKFGKNSGVIDRKKENEVLQALTEKGIGVRFYAGGEDFRIEEFYESTIISPTELKVSRRKLAQALAEFHEVNLKDSDDKSPQFLKVLEGKDELIQKAKEKASQGDYTREEKQMLEEIMSLTAENELVFLKNLIPSEKKNVVLSHNDLHAENVLCLKGSNRLLIIDYEYSDYNFRGYDFANIINESAFVYHTSKAPYFILDEDKLFTEEETRDFVTYYLFFSKFKIEQSEGSLYWQDENEMKDYVKKHQDWDIFEEEVNEILNEVKMCRLFSHFYWILWSVVMCKRPEFTFDYIRFAHERTKEYKKLKRKFFGFKRSHSKEIQQSSLYERTNLPCFE